MKAIAILFLSVALLGGCSNKETTEVETTSTTTESQPMTGMGTSADPTLGTAPATTEPEVVAPVKTKKKTTTKKKKTTTTTN